MIVYLTRTQYMAIVQSLPDDIYVWVETGRLEGNRMRWQEIPDFWLWLVERHIVDLDHGSNKSVAFRNAIQTIAKEVNRYRTHPAWRGECVVGQQPEVLVGWRTLQGGVAAFFGHGTREPVTLAPGYHKVGGQTVTCWGRYPQPAPEYPGYRLRAEEFWSLTNQDATLHQST